MKHCEIKSFPSWKPADYISAGAGGGDPFSPPHFSNPLISSAVWWRYALINWLGEEREHSNEQLWQRSLSFFFFSPHAPWHFQSVYNHNPFSGYFSILLMFWGFWPHSLNALQLRMAEPQSVTCHIAHSPPLLGW